MTGPLEIFVKLDGIEGESTVRGHEKETVVLSYEQGIENPLPPGSGGAAGRATFSGVRFRKPLDVGSIPLMLAAAAGSNLKDARFSFRRPGGNVDFYKVTLEEVGVTRLVACAGVGAQYPLAFETLHPGADLAGVIDEVTLDFRIIRWEYQPIGPNGRPLGIVKGGWDRRTNQSL